MNNKFFQKPVQAFIFLVVCTAGLVLMTRQEASAQRVEWVNEILEASTELTPTQYSAEQLIGPPDVPPGITESPNAWMPGVPDNEQYVKVGFEDPFEIRQIAVAENFNPGSLYQVFVYDEDDNEYLINTFNPTQIDLPSRMQYIFFDLTPFRVKAVKLVFLGGVIDGFYGIDAVGISNSVIPIRQEVNITESAITNVETERLGPTVNSIVNELKPMVTPDGNRMYFSRQNHPENAAGIMDDEDVWYSDWDEEKQEWKEAVNFGDHLNTPGPNFISSITPDGNTLVFTLGNAYKNKGKMKSGVSMVTKTSEGWTATENLDIEQFVNMSENANFFLANNRKVLVMSIESEPSYGDRDLYVSFLQEDGSWSKPLNLGIDVNTASEEAAPFLAPDDKTLYFSSTGYAGYGGQDIFVTRRLDDTWVHWTTPENLGPGINTDTDESFLNIPATGDFGYFVRDFDGDNLDIYRFDIPKEYEPEPILAISGKVFNAKTGEPMEARIYYETIPQGEEVGAIMSDPKTGDYKIMLPTGIEYGYLAEAEGFASVSANIDLTETYKFGEIEKNLFLVPVEVGAIVTLNNIFFDFDKYELKEGSIPELKRVIELMGKYPDIKVEIAGHTDAIGSEQYNQWLSQQRANAVVNYLTQNGVREDRLIPKGYGESKPIATNSQEKNGRELNRRVEFVIIEQ
jgi:OOP family OmpA-OmpF porin